MTVNRTLKLPPSTFQLNHLFSIILVQRVPKFQMLLTLSWMELTVWCYRERQPRARTLSNPSAWCTKPVYLLNPSCVIRVSLTKFDPWLLYPPAPLKPWPVRPWMLLLNRTQRLLLSWPLLENRLVWSPNINLVFPSLSSPETLKQHVRFTYTVDVFLLFIQRPHPRKQLLLVHLTVQTIWVL